MSAFEEMNIVKKTIVFVADLIPSVGTSSSDSFSHLQSHLIALWAQVWCPMEIHLNPLCRVLYTLIK